MKCFTDSAIELTWPGVPVTACASMRPCRSNTPAERSPHSRTIGENAVRISVCACSSTTAISRFHMICRSISSALRRHVGLHARLRSPLDHDTPGRVDARVEARGHERRGVVLGDHRRTRQRARPAPCARADRVGTSMLRPARPSKKDRLPSGAPARASRRPAPAARALRLASRSAPTSSGSRSRRPGSAGGTAPNTRARTSRAASRHRPPSGRAAAAAP